MSDLYSKLAIAGSTLLIGSIITIIITRITTKSLSRITSKTKNKTDDYILKALLDTIRPLGLIVSASLSWGVLDIKGDSLTCEKNKFTLSPTASIAPRSFLGPPLRRTPKIQQNHVTLLS